MPTSCFSISRGLALPDEGAASSSFYPEGPTRNSGMRCQLEICTPNQHLVGLSLAQPGRSNNLCIATSPAPSHRLVRQSLKLYGSFCTKKYGRSAKQEPLRGWRGRLLGWMLASMLGAVGLTSQSTRRGSRGPQKVKAGESEVQRYFWLHTEFEVSLS